jgi:hypothetical protein
MQCGQTHLGDQGTTKMQVLHLVTTPEPDMDGSTAADEALAK